MAEQGGQGRAGPQTQQSRPGGTNLQEVDQLHRQGGGGSGGGPEQRVLKPACLPKGGHRRIHQRQDAAAAQGRAKVQKGKRSQHPAAERGGGIFPRLAGGQEPGGQRRASIQAAPGGKKARHAAACRPQRLAAVNLL